MSARWTSCVSAHWVRRELHLFGWLTAELVRLAERHGSGRVVSMLEGGYDLQALRECSVAHVGALLAPPGE